MPPQTPTPQDPYTPPEIPGDPPVLSHDQSAPGVMPEYDQQSFIAPQIGGEDPTYKSRLFMWYGMRVGAVLLVLGLLIGGGVAAFTAFGGHKNAPVAQQSSDAASDASSTKQPTVAWECSDGYTQSPDDETVCVKDADTVDLETTYSCPSGYTKYNSGAKTTCQQASGDYKTQTVAATVSYYCPSGYSRSGSNCSRTVSKAASTTYKCPSGYTVSGTKCQKSSTQYTPAVASCPTGYTVSGTSVTAKCIRKIAATKKTTYSCPSGYTMSTDKKTCTRSVKPTNGTCPSGYKKVSSTKCTRTISTSSKVTYSCPSGYTLSSTTCTSTIAPTLTCPSGFTKSGTGTGTLCKKAVVTTISASASKTCSSGYKLSGSTCTSTTTKKAYGYYVCPTGYATQAGSKCTRTVGGTLKTAKAIPKKACPKGYNMTDSGDKCQVPSTETKPATKVEACDEGWELSKDASGTSTCVQATE